MRDRWITVDGNEAVARVAHRTNEVIAIYPITPSSAMGELADEYSTQGRQNLWGVVPTVVEMQSEGGAAGAVHGALQAGSLTTTFTSSQGLLLMIPNLYKIAGELTPFCLHVAARTVATHALSIFGDHSDVMACRQTGFALLASGSVQEAHDQALIAQVATLRARVPFLHFFDGFRTSHEVAKIEALDDEVLRSMLSDELVATVRRRALTPDRPVLRGTAQNPDTFFQAREASNSFHAAVAELVEQTMSEFGDLTGRSYRPYEYVGHPQAERVLVLMGSGAEVAQETVEWLLQRGERVGVVKVRLYRPFDVGRFVDALPRSVRAIAVLDRTKEPGAIGEPLYLDVVAALREARDEGRSAFAVEPRVVGGRYGLSSKEFDPAMVMAAFAHLQLDRPRNHFTVGIVDDVTRTSLPFDREFDLGLPDRVEAVFFGLGADGTVGANKNAIKIIGEETDNAAQGYFVYDSKKSGAMTISHLRFGRGPIRSSYLIKRASFVACHQFGFLERYGVLDLAAPGGTFLLNAPYGPDEIWQHLPREVQETILVKRLQLFVVDALRVARENGMGGRTSSIMQTCFFALSGVLPRDEAILKIKAAIEKTYRQKGRDVIERNFAAVDATLANLHRVAVPLAATATAPRRSAVAAAAPDFVHRVTGVMLAGHGDLLPVSAFPVDGTWPVGTSRWEKRGLALEVPVWDDTLCIQCNKCVLVCPHAAIRAKAYEPAALTGAPPTFKAVDFKASGWQGYKYTLQVAVEDCTGCSVCVQVCPAKDKENPGHKAIDMAPLSPTTSTTPTTPLRDAERANLDFFLELPEIDRERVKLDVRGSQLLQPLFEYSGACSACGETPYIKLITQLFGDRMLIANATGCSSIYGGNLPTTPYTINHDGRGPAWANSLFEDNAEFGFGMRVAVDQQVAQATQLLRGLAPAIGERLVDELIGAEQRSERGVAEQRRRVTGLKARLIELYGPQARRLELLADYLVRKTVWIVGGDGWAYDIGFGGLDHVLAGGRDVNLLVLDTEVYSNTGGQQSKATPLGATAKFAMAGKRSAKKDLGLMAMSYGNVYVAQVAFGAKDTHLVKALLEAESWRGPSLVIAYSHCIAHGYDLVRGCDQQRLAVDSGVWPLYRYDPRRAESGEPPFSLDSEAPKIPVRDYMLNEARFRMTEGLDPRRHRQSLEWAQAATDRRFALYRQMSTRLPQATGHPDGSARD